MTGEKRGRAAVVGQAITDRMDALGMSQQELALRSGVSTSTIRKLERGAQETYQRPKLTLISRALGWPPDAIARLFAGADPSELGGAGGEPPPATRAVEAPVPGTLTEKLALLAQDDHRHVEELVDRLLRRGR